MKKIIGFISLFLLLITAANAQIFNIHQLAVKHYCNINSNGLFVIVPVSPQKLNIAANLIVRRNIKGARIAAKQWHGQTLKKRVEQSLEFVWAADVIMTHPMLAAAADLEIPAIVGVTMVDDKSSDDPIMGPFVRISATGLLNQNLDLKFNLYKLNMHTYDIATVQRKYLQIFNILPH